MRKLIRPLVVLTSWTLTLGPVTASAQEIFRSVHSATLPTAETLPRGSWLFEISHRFDLPVSDGVDALWGLDGPVRNRMGLSFAVTDGAMIGISRSNLQDNVELNAKFVPLISEGEAATFRVGLMGGVAWNTQVFVDEGTEDNEMQAYAQLILNAGFGDRLAVGVVPSYLHNRRLRDADAEGAWAVGLHGQVHVTPSIGLLGEWIITEDGLDPGSTVAQDIESRDSGTFGIEIATRGHVFKIVLTNQPRMNQTQVLAGSIRDFEADEWRPGFNITRLLPF
jgi:hypothetical protein